MALHPSAINAALLSTHPTPPTSATTQIQTLHVYDHCPFCIRVDLILNWNNIPYQRKLYGYADQAGPKSLTGKKQLPVLEYTTHHGDTQHMPESLDIIAFLINNNFAMALKQDETQKQQLEEWNTSFKASVNDLTRSRILQMPPKLMDFATQEDRDYAMNKYISKGFSYEQAEMNYDVALIACNESLVAFEKQFLTEGKSIHGGDVYGMNDMLFLPDLRKLTCVEDLIWPDRVRKYVESACRAGGICLYDDWAC